MKKLLTHLLLLSLVILPLSACQPANQGDNEKAVEPATESVDQGSEEMGEKTGETGEAMGEATEETGEDMGKSTEESGEPMGETSKETGEETGGDDGGN
jgi:hypothetical protein